MYNSYFHFSDLPFENNLDQRFLFLSEDHKEVLAALLYFIRENKAFALLCGDIGTGKTMLISSFLERLPESVIPIIISNPAVEHFEILLYVVRELGISRAGKSILELIDEVKKALIEEKTKSRQYVVIIDEAHLLTDQSLEHIRLLSNIETPQKKLLQILLVGQYELSYKLDRPDMRQLRQRISINRFLSTLDSLETIQYIDYRLKVVGSSFDSCFDSNCKYLIYKSTGGVPRLINQICDNAFLICKAEGLEKVNKRILKKSDEALRSDLIFTPKPSDTVNKGVFSFYKRVATLAAVSICVVVLMLVGFFSYSTYFSKNTNWNFVLRGNQSPPEARTKHLYPQSASQNTSSEFFSGELTTDREPRSVQKTVPSDVGDFSRMEIQKDSLLTPAEIKAKDLPIIFPASVKGEEIYFTVQVHALFKSGDTATEVYRLRHEGYPAFIIETKNRKGKPVHKIRIGKYRTKTDAEEMALFLQHREKIPYIIIKSRIAISQQITKYRPFSALSASERKIRVPEYSNDEEHLYLDNLTQTKPERFIK